MNPFRQFLLFIRQIIDKILYKTSNWTKIDWIEFPNILNCTITNSYKNITLDGSADCTFYGNNIDGCSNAGWAYIDWTKDASC